MPIYEYECQSCGHRFEEWQKMSDKPVKVCPKCKARKVEKLISHTSFQLKGGGWYSDLYSSQKPGSGSAESSGAKSESASAGKSESTSAGKSESASTGDKAGGDKSSSTPATSESKSSESKSKGKKGAPKAAA
ncbi:MAG TPA: zinc ribbon domain-containing protein [Polyangia bacterium]